MELKIFNFPRRNQIIHWDNKTEGHREHNSEFKMYLVKSYTQNEPPEMVVTVW